MNQRAAMIDKIRMLELTIKQSEEILMQISRSMLGSEPSPASGEQEKNSSMNQLQYQNENTHSSKGSEESPDRVSSFEKHPKSFELVLNPMESIKRAQSFTPKSVGKSLVLRKQISTPGPRFENVAIANKTLTPEAIDIAIVYTSPLVDAIERNQTQFTQLLTCDDYDFCY